MKAFPMFIKTTGRRVVIVGGGEQAAQKARLILKTDAQIVLAAPDLDAELAAFVAAGRATHHPGPLDETLFAGAAMVFVATGCIAVDVSAHAIAQAARAPVNVVDQPELCDITTPSLVDRDPVVVAIGTEGTAPVLARQIKTQVEEILAPNLGGLAALSGRLRPWVARQVPRDARRGFWRWVFKGAPGRTWRAGDEAAAARAIKAAIAVGAAPQKTGGGALTIAGAGPGARDLLTLRTVERLQEADVIYYDADVDPGVLELARRDADRVALGHAATGRTPWPEDRTRAKALSDAERGLCVVHLIRPCPLADAQAQATVEACRSRGLRCEVVPGVVAPQTRAAQTLRNAALG